MDQRWQEAIKLAQWTISGVEEALGKKVTIKKVEKDRI
jgi:hypothetical protein